MFEGTRFIIATSGIRLHPHTAHRLVARSLYGVFRKLGFWLVHRVREGMSFGWLSLCKKDLLHTSYVHTSRSHALGGGIDDLADEFFIGHAECRGKHR